MDSSTSHIYVQKKVIVVVLKQSWFLKLTGAPSDTIDISLNVCHSYFIFSDVLIWVI